MTSAKKLLAQGLFWHSCDATLCGCAPKVSEPKKLDDSLLFAEFTVEANIVAPLFSSKMLPSTPGKFGDDWPVPGSCGVVVPASNPPRFCRTCVSPLLPAVEPLGFVTV